MPCYVPQEMVLTNGKGCLVYDNEDNEYLDMTAGIAVNSLGHNHPVVVKAIKKQAQRLIHVSNIFVNDKTLTLAKKLTALTGYDKVFFVNSGAEANEAALKLARRVAYDKYGAQKCEIISFNQSFHGRTFFSVSVGGQAKYSQGFGPIPEGITHVPFNDIETFAQTISDKTCAVIVEVVQGEGGILEIDSEFLAQVRELCTKFNALLIFDEVQTGVGRLGTFYGYEQFGVKPDILTSAKGLAAGIPIGAILTYDHIAEHFKPGTHGSTFGGNALACAVGSKVVDIIRDEEFLAKVRENGAYLRQQLQALNNKFQVFADIRGRGLLVGAQLAAPYSDYAALLQKFCTKNGLLVLLAGYDVIRFAPPLIITKSLIDKAMSLLELALLDFLTDREILAHKANEVESELGNKKPKNKKKAKAKAAKTAAVENSKQEMPVQDKSAQAQDEAVESINNTPSATADKSPKEQPSEEHGELKAEVAKESSALVETITNTPEPEAAQEYLLVLDNNLLDLESANYQQQGHNQAPVEPEQGKTEHAPKSKRKSNAKKRAVKE